MRRVWAGWWGIIGVSALLMQALWRLTPHALAPWRDGTLSPAQQALYVGWVGLNAYSEGYRAFQLRFCPRVLRRSLQLSTLPAGQWLPRLLAPAYCMGLAWAPRRRMLISWLVLLLIVLAVVLVRRTPQPWRGIIDGGVVVGLAWGWVALWWQALFGPSVVMVSGNEDEQA
ncbi:MAG: hypothetical protein ACPGUV_04930 [Polyangiales bacterium]